MSSFRFLLSDSPEILAPIEGVIASIFKIHSLTKKSILYKKNNEIAMKIYDSCLSYFSHHKRSNN